MNPRPGNPTAAPSEIDILRTDFVEKMILNVIGDLPFSRNRLMTACTIILKNKLKKSRMS